MPFECGLNSFYIKLNGTDNVYINGAVNLKTGMCCKFDDEDKVRLVNASIVINNFEEE